jgi:small-conductance mechanosensitive channel
MKTMISRETNGCLPNSTRQKAMLWAVFCMLFVAGATAQSSDSSLTNNKAANPPSGLDTSVYHHTAKLEQVNKIFAKWQSALANQPDTAHIRENIEEIESHSSNALGKITNPQYLTNLRFLRGNLILSTLALNKLEQHDREMKKAIKLLIAYDREVGATKFQESFAAIPPQFVDSLLRKHHQTVLAVWAAMQNLSNKAIQGLNPFQLRVTQQNIRAEFVHTIVQEALKEFNTQLFSNPHPIFTTPRSDSIYLNVKEEARFSLDFTSGLVKSFITNNASKLLANGFALFIIIVIIYRNHRSLTNQLSDRSYLLKLAPLVYSKPLATALCIGFFFSLLIYRNIPAAILEFIIVGQLIIISILIWHRVSKALFWRWIALCFLFVRFGIMNLLVGISWEARWGLLLLNLGSIYLILSSYRILKKEELQTTGLLTALVAITTLQQVASVVLNIVGYPNAALMQSVNSIFNLTLAVTIAITIKILGELLNLVDLRLLKHEMIDEEEFGLLPQRAIPYLTILGVAFWIFAFFNTLNLDRIILNHLQVFLSTKQSFGSASFTYGNLATFAIVFLVSIWLSHLSSIIIDLFSGRNQLGHRNAKLKNGKLFLRLFILIGGLFVAFIASGIPAQQLTIILGALSVGIGLGLQNLVGNLVSGIIIALEKPIKVGDVITVGNATGTIAEVGLRSTIMVGKNGLKIYIPNGELLSSPLFNQSTLAVRRAISINFLISEKTPVDTMRQLVQESLLATPGVLPQPEGEILINASTDKGLQVTVYAWINRTDGESGIRSRLYENIISRFQQAQLDFGSFSNGGRDNDYQA